MAQKHCPDALQTIVHLAAHAENENTRLAAAKELLDRGYGKSRQAIEADVRHTGGDSIASLLEAIGTHPANRLKASQ